MSEGTIQSVIPIGSVPSTEKIEYFNSILKEYPQEQIPVQHTVHAGMYARTAFIKAGTYAVGAMLNHDNISIMVGDCTCSTDDGMVRLQGYQVIPASANHKRVGYFNEDTWWTMVMCIPEGMTDIEEIQKYITSEYEQLQAGTILEFKPTNPLLE